MNKTLCAISIVAMLLSPLFVFAQSNVSKGMSADNTHLQSAPLKPTSLYSNNKKNCYALAIGVKKVYGSNYTDLRFPEEDCTSFLNGLDRLFRFQYEITKVSLTTYDKSYESIFNTMSKFSEIDIESGDIVLIYLSGHGITENDNYYFLCEDSDLTPLNNVVTGSQIINMAAKLADKGANVLIFLDTCQSGGVLNENIEENKGGIAIFPAASDKEDTNESLAKAGSAFGNQLREILSGKTNLREEKQMTVGDLSRGLKGSMKNVEPKFINGVDTVTLVSRLSEIVAYNEALDNYNTYINKAKGLMKDKKYYKALEKLKFANEMADDKTIFAEDTADIEDLVSKCKTEIEKQAKKIHYDFFWDDLSEYRLWGGSLTSDFKKFPLGIKGDCFLSILHLGADISIGQALIDRRMTFKVNKEISFSIGEKTDTGETSKELMSSGEEKVKGSWSYTVTPGIFYKYVSLDCGLGQIFTETSRNDTYKITNGTNISYRDETIKTKNRYFVIKPGISVLCPIDGDTSWSISILASARYRICPSEKSLNGFEFALGVAIPFGYL